MKTVETLKCKTVNQETKSIFNVKCLFILFVHNV